MWLIDAGYGVVEITIMAAIIGTWKKPVAATYLQIPVSRAEEES